jgi:hypothetical protein
MTNFFEVCEEELSSQVYVVGTTLATCTGGLQWPVKEVCCNLLVGVNLSPQIVENCASVGL